MQNGAKHLLLLLISLFMLVGCSIFSSEKPVFTMNERPVFKQSYKPVIAWTTSIGSGVGKYYSQLTPATDSDAVYAASRDGEVSALNLQTGKTIWSVDLSKIAKNDFNSAARFSGGIGQDSDLLFIGTENGQVLAINKKQGKLAWISDVKGEVIATPVYSDDMVIVHTNRGDLLSLNAQTGKENWSQSNKQPNLSLRGSSAPSVAEGGVVYGRSDGFLCVVRLQTGQPLWELPIARAHGATALDRLTDIDMKPVIIDNVIYAQAYNGNMVAIQLLTSKQLWSQPYSGYNNIAASGETLYITDHRGYIYALDQMTGKKIWENKQLSYRNVTSIAVANQYIVIGDAEGYLYWINRDDGKFVAQQKLDSDGLYIAPIVTENYLYLQTRSGDLIAIEKPSLSRRKN
ncbi:MAG: outer membrane protein assembly factor BamB [Psychromonas sp.]|nr:outer membrane protein assembly factor BamB [Psychromonas sp.]